MDVYSLGVVLYQMVAGRTPFEGSPLTILYKVAQKTPPPPTEWRPDLDLALQAIILKAMAAAKDRFARAQAFADALGEWYEATGRPLPVKDQGVSTSTIPVASIASGLPAPVKARPKRKMGVALAAAVVLLAVVGAAVLPLIYRTADGTLKLELLEPDAEVIVDGETKTVVVNSQKLGRIELKPGKHAVTVKWCGQELVNDTVTLKSGKDTVLVARVPGVPGVPGAPEPAGRVAGQRHPAGGEVRLAAEGAGRGPGQARLAALGGGSCLEARPDGIHSGQQGSARPAFPVL